MIVPPFRLTVPDDAGNTQQPPYQIEPVTVRTAVPLMLTVPLPISVGRKANEAEVWLNAPPERL